MVRRRLKLLAAALALPFLVVVFRLAFLQLVPANHERSLRLSQHRMRTFLPPVRGRILARDGRVLAGNRPVHDLRFRYRLLNPRQVPLAILVKEVGRSSRFASLEEVERRIVEAADPAALALERDAGPAASAETEAAWRPLISNLDRTAAGRVRAALRRHPGFFEVRPAPAGAMEVWFHARRAAAMEITLHRLARSLAGAEPAAAAYERLAGAIRSELARIESLVAVEAERDRDQNVREEIVEHRMRTNRALYFERSWLLAAGVPAAAVTEIEYYPELYPGIEVEDGVRRQYPLREAAGTITGYLGRLSAKREQEILVAGGFLEALDEAFNAEEFAEKRQGRFRRPDLAGTGGLEERYEPRLRGAYGLRVVSVDKMSRPREILEDLPPRRGEDLKTTVDADLQGSVYGALEALLASGGGPGAGCAGSAAVMSLAPGEEGALLAAAGFPGVDPNRMTGELAEYAAELEGRWGGQTHGWFLDRPSRHALFPGSVFKLVLAAAAMESARPWEGEYSPGRRYPCRREFELVKGIHCAAANGHNQLGTVDLTEALQYSCNNYFYSLGLKHLGPDLIYPWALHFGYGRPPGLDLPPSELERGRLRPPDAARSPRATCQLSIGQVFVEATPLQVLRSFAAIALGGRLPRPYLIEPAGPPEAVPFRNPRTVETIREGLARTGHFPGGTAAEPGLGLNRFAAAYKTGTAEFTVEGRTLHHAWLAGYAPMTEPRIAFVVVIEKTRLHGAEACAPVAREILGRFAASDPAYVREGRSDGSAALPGD